jgi:hypothetical protein
MQPTAALAVAHNGLVAGCAWAGIHCPIAHGAMEEVFRILFARSLVHLEVQALAPAGNVCQIQPQSDAKGKASQRQDKQPRTSIKQTGVDVR